MKNSYSLMVLVVMLSGCASQKISSVDTSKMNLVCVAEHKDVKENVLKTIQEDIINHRMKYRVIPASYEINNRQWTPTVANDQTAGCDALLFYAADWKWDITIYMSNASIWMTTPDNKKSLGYANYDVRLSQLKFINARKKIFELVDGLLAQQINTTPLEPKQDSAANIPAPTAQNKSADTTTNTPSQKLRELQTMRNDGLITEADYQKKKKQLLEQF